MSRCVEHLETSNSDSNRRVGEHERHALKRGDGLAESNTLSGIFRRVVGSALCGAALGRSDEEPDPADGKFEVFGNRIRSTEELVVGDRCVEVNGEGRHRAECDLLVVACRFNLLAIEDCCSESPLARVDPNDNQRRRNVSKRHGELAPDNAPSTVAGACDSGRRFAWRPTEALIDAHGTSGSRFRREQPKPSVSLCWRTAALNQDCGSAGPQCTESDRWVSIRQALDSNHMRTYFRNSASAVRFADQGRQPGVVKRLHHICRNHTLILSCLRCWRHDIERQAPS